MSAATAAKSLQSCLTLCDPIDGSPPGPSVPGILQARTLEWVAISFSNAWKWKVKVKSLSHVWLLANPMDRSPPGSSIHGIFQARVLEWGAIAFSVFLSCLLCVKMIVHTKQHVMCGARVKFQAHLVLHVRWLVQADSHWGSRTVGFPGVSVVRNPPAGDTGLISALGGSQCCEATETVGHSYWTCTLEPGVTTSEPTCHDSRSPCALKPLPCNKRSHCDERPAHRDWRKSLLAATREKPAWQQRHSTAKNK